MTVMAQFRATDVSNVRVSANVRLGPVIVSGYTLATTALPPSRVRQVLGGREVCVLAQKDYPKGLGKARVEKLVHSLGGRWALVRFDWGRACTRQSPINTKQHPPNHSLTHSLTQHLCRCTMRSPSKPTRPPHPHEHGRQASAEPARKHRLRHRRLGQCALVHAPHSRHTPYHLCP